ncbi:hypothetical protein HYY70_00140 [Candidatus Woesearchaeota archaeon]|nr:hypothetical protein [Candidatus Woesearchaeota archaeon]
MKKPMHKVALFFLILVLFLPLVYSETKIFSGKVITDTDKVIDGKTFKFIYEQKNDKVFVQTPSTNLIVANGDCKSNNAFRVCINGANFSHKNTTTYINYYEIDASIYQLAGGLSASSKISSSTLLPGESAELTITIENPTDYDISSILLSYELQDFYVQEVKNCMLNENSILWRGTLKSKYDKICTAIIIPKKEGTLNLAGNLTYFNIFENQVYLINATKVTVLPKQLKISQFIDTYLEVNHPFYLNTSLQNIDRNETMEVSINVDLPSNIAILKEYEGFSKDFNILRRSIKLGPSSIFNYSFYLMAMSEANTSIKHYHQYTIRGTTDTIENKTLISPAESTLSANFSSEYTEITPGQDFIVVAKISNPSKFQEFTNVKAKLTAPFNHQAQQNLTKLSSGESYTIINSTLSMPKDLGLEPLENNTIKINLSIEYNFAGISKTTTKDLELKIKYTSNSTTEAKNIDPLPQNQNATQEEKVPEIAHKDDTFLRRMLQIIESTLLDDRALLFLAIIFLSIFLVPFTIHLIKKTKAGKKNENGEEIKIEDRPKNF